jgi:hypothetical protein
MNSSRVSFLLYEHGETNCRLNGGALSIDLTFQHNKPPIHELFFLPLLHFLSPRELANITSSRKDQNYDSYRPSNHGGRRRSSRSRSPPRRSYHSRLHFSSRRNDGPPSSSPLDVASVKGLDERLVLGNCNRALGKTLAQARFRSV